MRRFALAVLAVLTVSPALASEALTRGPSGFPIPRFVSLSSDRVNVRMGPTHQHKVKWTFVKTGLPVEVVSEHFNWRRVRDADGEEGWIHHTLLSGRRTGLVSPWSDRSTLPLRARPDATASTTALLEPSVLVRIAGCDGAWCEVSAGRLSGFVRQGWLWGVYPNERLD